MNFTLFPSTEDKVYLIIEIHNLVLGTKVKLMLIIKRWVSIFKN